jgi:hypothetical protein
MNKTMLVVLLLIAAGAGFGSSGAGQAVAVVSSKVSGSGDFVPVCPIGGPCGPGIVRQVTSARWL